MRFLAGSGEWIKIFPGRWDMKRPEFWFLVMFWADVPHSLGLALARLPDRGLHPTGAPIRSPMGGGTEEQGLGTSPCQLHGCDLSSGSPLGARSPKPVGKDPDSAMLGPSPCQPGSSLAHQNQAPPFKGPFHVLAKAGDYARPWAPSCCPLP